MNVVCCLARVPDTATRIRIALDGHGPDLTGAQYVINPYDEFALEEALRFRDARGGQVTILHVGPVDFQKDLRSCLAKGADRAIQIRVEGPLGPAAIASLLAGQIRPLLPAVVFLGKQSVDGDVGATGHFLAHLLDLPVVSKISSLRLDGDSFAATREVEGGIETVEGRLPAVFTAEKGLNEPRRAGLKEIMAAKKKPLDLTDGTAPEPGLEVVEMRLPPERKPGRIVGEGPGAVAALLDALRNEAKVL
jgi:electron transfer flavoprotein beta subunit